MDTADVTLEHLAAETERVVASASALSNDAVLAPSLCSGWSRGHVLTHLARNAEGIERVCVAAVSGRPGTMYDSDEKRDADVVSGAARGASALAEDVRSTGARLDLAMRSLESQHLSVTVPRTPGGREVPVRLVSFLRLRELVVHHVDLDVAYGFDQLSPDLSALLLDDAVARLRDSVDERPSLDLRTDEGERFIVSARAQPAPSTTADTTARQPDAVVRVSGSTPALLLWLTRGIAVDLRYDPALPTLPNGG